MGLFRRKRQDDDADVVDGSASPAGAGARGVADGATAGTDPGVDAGAQPPAEEPRRDGPWDEADAPDDGRQRLDLGGLRVPVLPQTEVRVEMNPQGGVIAVTLLRPPATMQISAFAAPRTEGIWDDVRAEIAAALRSSGGRAEEADGPFGTELRAMVPTDVPDRGRVLAPARFLGVDGPRWFLRALLTGPAAQSADAEEPLLDALRQVVVVRGSDPMAVRDPLPLSLPKELQQRAAEQVQQVAQQQPSAGESGRTLDT